MLPEKKKQAVIIASVVVAGILIITGISFLGPYLFGPVSIEGGSTSYSWQSDFLSNSTIHYLPEHNSSSGTGIANSGHNVLPTTWLNTSVWGSSSAVGGTPVSAANFHLNFAINGSLNKTFGFSKLIFSISLTHFNSSQDHLQASHLVRMQMTNLNTTYKLGENWSSSGSWYPQNPAQNTGSKYRFSLELSYNATISNIIPGKGFNISISPELYGTSNIFMQTLTLVILDTNAI